jgi:hypothetical protein
MTRANAVAAGDVGQRGEIRGQAANPFLAPEHGEQIAERTCAVDGVRCGAQRFCQADRDG